MPTAPAMPWEEPSRGGYPDPALLARPGLEQVRAFLTGHAPKPPIHHLTGMRPTEVGPGLSTFTMPASDWMVGPHGVFDATMLAVLADGPLGCALQTALPPMRPYTTAEMSLSYVRAPRLGGEIVARGSVIHRGRTFGLTEVSMADAEGRLVAHGTSRLLVLPPVGKVPETPPPLPPVADPRFDTLDPYQRPVMGSPVAPQVWDAQTGLEVLERLVADEVRCSPSAALTGKRLVGASEGHASFALPATEWLNSPFPRMEGGVIAMLADTAQWGAVQSTLDAGDAAAPLDLKVNFLRPVEADGRELQADAEVVHRGRTLAVTRSVVRNTEGKPVAIGAGTASIQPRRR